MKKGVFFIILALLLVLGVVLYQRRGAVMENFSPSNQPTAENQLQGGTQSTSQSKTQEINLVVNSPKDMAVVTAASVTVSGTTVPNADVSVDDTDLKADSNGNFSTTVNLDEGDNTIVVVANDANGLSAEKEITVTYEPAGTNQ